MKPVPRLWIRVSSAIGTAAALVVGTADVGAQVLLAPERLAANQQIACDSSDNAVKTLATLRDHFLSGRWDHLQRETRTLLHSCTFQSESGDPDLFTVSEGKRRPNLRRDWYSIVLGTVDTNDEPLILRYLLHEDPVPYPYSTVTLDVPAAERDIKGSPDFRPKTPRLIQVFLAPHKALELETRIQATETPNPLVEQVADVVKAVADPGVVLPLLKGLLPPSTDERAPVSDKRIFASAHRVFPPFARGDYKYSDVIRARPVLDAEKNALLRAKFAAADEAAKAAATRPQEAALARALAEVAITYLRNTAATACTAESYQASCWTALEQRLEERARRFCLDEVAFCTGDRDELLLHTFKEIGSPPKPATATASTTFTVLPLQRLSFGLVSAYMLGACAPKDRVKVDGAKVVADPIGRALNAVVLNVHPPFNPKAPRMESGERWRVFVGTVVTPNLGFTVGGGYGFLRNLSISGGYGLLLIPTLRSGDELDKPPSDGTKPFRSGVAHTGFLGLGYKFK